MAVTECVRVMGRDTKEPGKLNDRSAIVDVCHAYSGVRSSAGSAPSEGTNWMGMPGFAAIPAAAHD